MRLSFRKIRGVELQFAALTTCGSIDGVTIIISLAHMIQRIGNPELRDIAAFALDEVHAWRCGLIAREGECDAMTEAFAPMVRKDGEWETTAVYRYLQPLSSFSGWYLAGPFVRWLQTLQDIDEKDNLHWRFDRKILQPWKFIPRPRGESRMVARVAASRTWQDADAFIAEYIVAAVPRLKEGYGTPSFFCSDDIPPELSRACYDYSLDILGELATAAVEDWDGDSMSEFAEALAEAITIGMLWD